MFHSLFHYWYSNILLSLRFTHPDSSGCIIATQTFGVRECHSSPFAFSGNFPLKVLMQHQLVELRAVKPNLIFANGYLAAFWFCHGSAAVQQSLTSSHRWDAKNSAVISEALRGFFQRHQGIWEPGSFENLSLDILSVIYNSGFCQGSLFTGQRLAQMNGIDPRGMVPESGDFPFCMSASGSSLRTTVPPGILQNQPDFSLFIYPVAIGREYF